MNPGVRSSDWLKNVFAHEPGIVPVFEHAHHHLESELLSFEAFVDGSGQDSKDIHEDFRPSFFEHFSSDGSELCVVVVSVDFDDYFAGHLVHLLEVSLLG